LLLSQSPAKEIKSIDVFVASVKKLKADFIASIVVPGDSKKQSEEPSPLGKEVETLFVRCLEDIRGFYAAELLAKLEVLLAKVLQADGEPPVIVKEPASYLGGGTGTILCIR